MLESAWLMLGSLGLLWQLVAIGVMSVFNPNSNASVLQFFTSVLSFICYGVFTYGSLNIVRVSGGLAYQYQMPAVTILGVALTVSSLFLVLSKPIDAIGRYREASPGDL